MLRIYGYKKNVSEIGNVASIPLMFNHLKRNPSMQNNYLNIQGSTQAAINNEIATLVAKAAGKFFSFILSIKLKEWF